MLVSKKQQPSMDGPHRRAVREQLPRQHGLGSSKMPAMQQVSKKRKFVADGVFRAELDEFLRRELGEDGYAG